jgi:hypothetical protein
MIPRMSDAVRDALLEALLNCVASLALSDDELVHPDVASDLLNDITHDLGSLNEADRALLTALIRRRAAAEPDPVRREVFEDSPEDLGLLDDEDESAAY